MTNQEAMQAIKNNWPPENYTTLREALTMAIQAIEKQSVMCDLTKKEAVLLLYETSREEEISEPIAVYLEDCISETKYEELRVSGRTKLKSFIKSYIPKGIIKAEGFLDCKGCALEHQNYLCRPLHGKTCTELHLCISDTDTLP